MNEVTRTVVFAGAALGLVALAGVTAPRVRQPALFSDRGESFFPGFTDPGAVRSLELVQFSEHSGNVEPLKVLNRDGIWTIPSHYGYPADVKDRLAQLAAAVITLRKDDVRSDTLADHERCGVTDPMDAGRPGGAARGTRVTIRGANERLLADIIIGLPAEGHDGYRYVRLPGQRRTYVSRVGDLQLSTAFGDWIDRDLLQVRDEEIDGIYIRRYSLDERNGHVGNRETTLVRKTADGSWSVDGVGAGETVDTAAVSRLVATLVNLPVAGVLPKPRGIAATLGGSSTQAQVAAADRDDLARKGFYLTTSGELVSNDGEVVVRTSTGVFYSLRFGEVAPMLPGIATAIAAPTGEASLAQPAENRYLLIMAGFDGSTTSRLADASEGEGRAASLRARFAPWYYIIPSDGLSRIRPRRGDIVTPRVSSTPVQPLAHH